MTQATFRVRRSKQEIENLQENLVQTPEQSTATAWMSQTSITNRYEQRVLNERRHVSFALMVQKDIDMRNTQQIKSLERRVHNLEEQAKRMQVEGSRCNKQLTKIYEAQNLTTFLFQQRQQARSQLMKQQEKRRQVCSELRINDRKNIDVSKQNYQEHMRRRIKSIKEKSQRNSEEKSKLELSLLEANRQRYLRIKNEQSALRFRLRRIEEFKMKRARKNYLDKVESCLEKNLERQRQLNELAELQQSQMEALEQTKKLEKQSKKIEQLFENFFSTEC